MLREQFNEALKQATLGRDQCAMSTIRLILAALKDRDIAARGQANPDGVSDEEILNMLQTMIKQRREAIKIYEQGGRLELAEQEAEEIKIIERFLPEQMGEADIHQAVRDAILDLGAMSLKDIGRVMTSLRERYSGRMDFAKASADAKRQLS